MSAMDLFLSYAATRGQALVSKYQQPNPTGARRESLSLALD